MNFQSMLNILSILSLRRRVFRTVVLALLLMAFIGNFSPVRAQIGHPTRLPTEVAGRPAEVLRNINFCINAGADFSIDIEISQLAIGSWVDDNVEWDFPTGPGDIQLWDVDRTTTLKPPFEVVTLRFQLDPNIPTLREIQLGGNFIARRIVGGTTTDTAAINIPIRPVARVADTIFMESILCQGSIVTARINRRPEFPLLPGAQLVPDDFYDNMMFRWNVIDSTTGESVLDNRNNISPGVNQLHGDTIFVFENFNPSRHHIITVERAFCHPTGWAIFSPSFNTPTVEHLERNFSEDTTIIVISNPPLDTAADNRQDTIFRLAWIDDQWITIPHLSPVCVNYGSEAVTTSIQAIPSGFTRTLAVDDLALSSGFLFFQVGSKPDTMVRYIWEVYPLGRLERVFVGEGLNSPLNPRWRTLLDDPDPDPWHISNYGGFGRSVSSGALATADSSYRAAFRVIPLSEGDPLFDQRWDSIIISVTAICSFCEDPPESGNRFQNDIHPINIGHAWDTVKPIYQFDLRISTVVGTPNFTPVSDTACINTTLNFSVRPTNHISDWNSDVLRLEFNVDRFAGWASEHDGPGTQLSTNTNISFGVAVDQRLTGTVNLNFPLTPGDPIQPHWRTFTPQNGCFTRNRPAVIMVNDTARFSSPDDIDWHALTTFYVMPFAPAPLVIDPIDDRPRIGAVGNPPIFICRNRRTDSVGNPIPGLLGEGVSFTFGMGARTGVNPGQYTFTEDPGLIAGNVPANFLPGVENFVSPTGPAATNFYGFFNPPGGEGNPNIFITRAWSHYIPEGGGPDPRQRMTLRLLPDPYFDPSSLDEDESVFIFAAQNACGRGDSTVIRFIIIDTISVHTLTAPHFVREPDYPNPDEWVNLANEHHCEGETLWHRIGMLPDDIGRDSVFIQWRHPDSWIVNPLGTGEGLIGGSYWDQLGLTFGRDTGQVSVNVVCARCGGGRPIYSPEVKPIPYFRAENYWLNFPNDGVCQDSEYRFTIDRAPFTNPGPPLQELMGDFFIQFPNENWIIEGNITGVQSGRRNRDTIRQDQFITQTTPPEIWFDVRIRDSIGNWGDILIRWLDPRCDIPGSRVNIRDPFWDTTQVFTHTFPLAPQPHIYDGTRVWHDTVCSRETVWFSVQPNPKDTIQYNFYEWIFPEGWEVVDSGSRRYEDGTWVLDSVQVMIGYRNPEQEIDTIIVRARSSRCNDGAIAQHRIDASILRMPVYVMDTAVFEMDSIRDMITGAFGTNPCAGDTLRLFVNRPYSVDSIDWSWGRNREHLAHTVPDDPYDTIFGVWEFIDKSLLPDVFAFRPTGPGTDTLFVQVTMFNRCNASHSPIIPFSVAEGMVPQDPITFLAPDPGFTGAVCEGQSIFFEVNEVLHADRYIWHLPWLTEPDTITVTETVTGRSRYLIPEAIGEIWIQAMNSCSYTEEHLSQRIEITHILDAPLAPRALNFGRRTEVIDEQHWVFDTICAQRLYQNWTISLNTEEPHYEAWAPFLWMQLGGDTLSDISEFFTFSENDSVFDIFPVVGNVRRYNAIIGVTARREQCPNAPGDTLRILLTSADTIPLERLGMITVDFPDGHLPCPGDTVEFSVSKDSAFGYRWILPENDTSWRFASDNPLDNIGPSVQIIVGENPARIRVVTTSGFDFRENEYFCPDLQNQDTSLYIMVTPFPPPVLAEFSEFPFDGLCAEDVVTFTVELTAESVEADEFEFIFFKHRAGDTLMDTLEILTDHNSILFDDGILFTQDWMFDSITVEVRAINNSCWTPKISDSITATFRIFNSPRVSIDGNMHPCLDDSQIYTIVLSDPHVTFDFDYFAAPGVLVTPGDPPLRTVHVSFGGDSVRFMFSNISSNLCPFIAGDTVIPVRTDITPAGGFEFEIIYHKLVCRDAEHFPLEVVNVGGAPTPFTQEWFKYEVVVVGVDTIFTTIGNASSISILQSEFTDEMHFMVVATYELCVSDATGSTRVELDTSLFFTVTAVDPVVARIERTDVVRIVGNRADVLRRFNYPPNNYDSIALGENLRFIGKAHGRPLEFEHLIFGWGGDFKSEIINFGPDPANSDTAFSGTIFFTDQTFFFAVVDTSAYGCFSMDSVRVFIRELSDTTVDINLVDIPNAFTPHGGNNPYFMRGESVCEITILNRWGVVIYHAVGDRAREGWDGRESRTNRMVDRGDYFFIITITDCISGNCRNENNHHIKTGVVTVL